MSGRRRNSLLKRFFRSVGSHEIAPEEIFLDASNLPDFDASQFEGRLDKPIHKSTVSLVAVAFFVIAAVFLGRAYFLQVVNGEVFAAQSARNHLANSLIFSERGVIFDRNGTPLVWNEVKESESFAERRYTDTRGVAHILGYVKYPQRDSSGFYWRDTFEGLDGIEANLNSTLAGENGTKIVEIDAKGEILSESVVRLPVDGKSVTLSIDAELSEKLYERIVKRAREAGFQGGVGVIMDVETGELITLVSYPDFDPQVLTDGEDRKTIASYNTDSRGPFLNRAISGLYTPGSTVKPFMAVGALEEGVITPEKQILSTGQLEVPNPYAQGTVSVFKDWKAHGWVDVRRAIAVSSNVYFYEVGGGFKDQKGIGIAGIEKYARLFGFGEKTGIPLSGEEAGTIPNPEWKRKNFEDGEWRLGDTYNTVIGQYGFQVTPLQLTRGIAAIANGGRLLDPTLIAHATSSGMTLNASPETLRVVREGMRLSVAEGSAIAIHGLPISFGGKTGTAQLGAQNEFLNSWITGFFPYEKPRYAFSIIMERAPAGTTAGAPLVALEFFQWLSEAHPEYWKGD
ncbi:hypothetical protein COU17_02245 [Candidatus Kaiserbacteria bacterium CG10_big_fil_rev_8_21_14_0_10_49_17]|uniref:Penicillin-binding protein 2 n=1 Tax=Candidatus Kaiserbacteria bacterium CG10_big_fil_rev_8_21_14_0_10_49_17 TaxID=1974609 RepID=A0A2M6WE67_9BACT|nr:MAG: hypothetical protein COU17_02245 [Candidatus Kaiserbacteria bacterium CG10_big_fil_rev_8_21_14_0_10_49_17]